MKKILHIILVVILFIFICSCVYASSEDTLSKIENDIYGFSYNKDKSISRVERLEKTIYGRVSTGDVNKRIIKLSKDISADVIGLEITPSRDTFLAEEQAAEDNSVDYPIVNDIEKKLFNTTYKNRDLHTRIVTIEKKLFGKIYDVDDYSKRMDRIKAEMYPGTTAGSNNYSGNNYYDYSDYNNNILSSDDLSGTRHNRFKMPFGQRNYTRPYTNYGDNFSSYNNDEINQRNLNDDLTQLEYDVFGTEFSSDDTKTRIKRLNSANKAKKSSQRYDSQKFQQRMSTAMEIGAMILMILAMVL